MDSIIQTFVNEKKQKYSERFYFKEFDGKYIVMTNSIKEELQKLVTDNNLDVKVESIEDTENCIFEVTSDYFSLYTQNQEHFETLADQIIKGEIFCTVEEPEDGEWIPVVVRHDFENEAPKELGWLIFNRAKVKKIEKMPESEKKDGSLEEFYKLSEEFISKNSGINYQLGGKTHSTGFDCSGFTQVMINKLTKAWLPRISRWQARVGESIEEKNIKPADLILFFNPELQRISHVGLIYKTNNGKLPTIIHCPLRDNGIVIEDLNTAKWLNTELTISHYQRVGEII